MNQIQSLSFGLKFGFKRFEVRFLPVYVCSEVGIMAYLFIQCVQEVRCSLFEQFKPRFKIPSFGTSKFVPNLITWVLLPICICK